MAVLDAKNEKLVVRVVYDGAAGSGKTTNVSQLCRFFTTLRRSPLVQPAEAAGRTLFFDWMHLDGGLVAGLPLRCQLVTVPGQAVLSHRRLHLVNKADALIFVCESTEPGVDIGRRMLANIQALLGQRTLPIVVQANKQDLPRALPPAAVASALGLGGGTPVVPAKAHEGVGLRETLVLAIRAAADNVQRHILEHGLAGLRGEVEGWEALQRAIVAEEDAGPKPRAAAAQALATLAHSAPVPPAAAPAVAVTAVREAPAPAVDATAAPEPPPATSAAPAPSAVPVERAQAGGAALAPAQVDPPPAAPPPSSGVVAASPDRAPEARARTPEPAAAGAAAAAVPPTRSLPARAEPTDMRPGTPKALEPALPRADAPLGLVWPAVPGRDILRAATSTRIERRSDLVGQHGTSDGSGTSDAYIYQAGEWCLKTSARRRYADIDAARDAMLRLARRKTALGELLPPRTVLCLSIEPATGAHWLWTVTPWMVTLRAWMTRSADTDDVASLELALCAFAEAGIQALLLTARRRLVLDVHPSNFSLAGGRLVYLDDDVLEGGQPLTIGHALLRRVDEYARWPAAIDGYLHTLLAGLVTAAAEARAVGLDVAATLEAAHVTSQAGREARVRLVDALRKRQR